MGPRPPLPVETHVPFESEIIYKYPHPLAPNDRNKEFSLLRDELAKIEAGDFGRPTEEVFVEFDPILDQIEAGKE